MADEAEVAVPDASPDPVSPSPQPTDEAGGADYGAGETKEETNADTGAGDGGSSDDPGQEVGSEFAEDPDSRTCGVCPRVIKGQLLGTEEGWSIDFYMNPCTMILSVMIIWVFVIWCAVDDEAGRHIGELQSWIVYYWTWFYVASMIIMGGFVTYLLFGRFGDIKLGPKDEPPRFSMGSWFAMLFSAGVGVGLYFFGVAEPIWHYYDAKLGNNRYYTDGDNLERALDAMNVSWFHWGLTASSVYCAVGLPLAYFTHVKNAPLKFSAAFVPLLGKKYANGFVGDCIDTFAVVGTMFGVSTSLGLGVIQLNAMLNFMDPDNIDDDDTDLRIMIIWIITAFATVSVFTGLDVGIRRLSEGNFAFCLILLIYLFFICDPYYLTNLFIQTAGYHVQNIFQVTFFTDAFQQAGFTDGNTYYEGFMSSWTVFYWGWWIAWSPFVGIFIAQISRGRTIREFILGNMFVPTLFTSLWLCVFGGIGLYNELAFDDMTTNYLDVVQCSYNVNTSMNWTLSDDRVKLPLANNYSSNNGVYMGRYGEYKGQNVVYLECFGTATMLFEMIDQYPLGGLMNVLAGIGIVTYFVTSSDSASHVIDVLTANGNEEPPKIQRIFWAMSEGAVASVLLSVGGSEALSALQTVSIAAGLPFCAILLLLCYAFWFTLNQDTRVGGPPPGTVGNHWDLDILDSTNPQLTNKNHVKNWFVALFCPCVIQWQNYSGMAAQDTESRVFAHDSKWAKIMWAFMIFASSTLAFIFAMVGIVEEGWPTLGLTLYVFFIVVGAWQRIRIRSYFGIDGGSSNALCDVFSHCCCMYCWTMTQEAAQVSGDYRGNGTGNVAPGSPKGVARVPSQVNDATTAGKKDVELVASGDPKSFEE